MLPFRTRLSADQRRLEYQRIGRHRESRVPAILERGSNLTPPIDKEKFLLPFDLTMAQFAFVVRRRLNMDSSKALFLLVNGCIPPAQMTVHDVYNKNVSDDGFLYVVYTLENTFG